MSEYEDFLRRQAERDARSKNKYIINDESKSVTGIVLLIGAITFIALIVFSLCACNNHNPQKEAINLITTTLPYTLINEKSYDPISFGELQPIYKTQSDFDLEMEICQSLIEHTKYILEDNMGEDYIYVGTYNGKYKYIPEVCWKYVDFLDKLGYFNIDEFIHDDSFYNEKYTIRETINPSRIGIGRGTSIFAGGDMYGISQTSKSRQYFKELIQYLEKRRETINAAKQTHPILMAYKLEHKYNQSNQYGGIETQNAVFYFNILLTRYWRYGEENKIITHSMDNTYSMKSY